MRKNIFLSLLFAGAMSASLVEGQLSEYKMTIADRHIKGLQDMKGNSKYDKERGQSIERLAGLYEKGDSGQKAHIDFYMKELSMDKDLHSAVRARSQSRDSTRSSSPASTQKPANQRVDKEGFESITLKNQNTAYKKPVEKQETKPAAPASGSSTPKAKSALEMAANATSDDQAQIDAAKARALINEIKDQKGRISRDVANFYFNELNKPEYTKNKYVNNDIEKFFKLLEEKSGAPLNSTPANKPKEQKPAVPKAKSALEMAANATSDDQAQIDAAKARALINEIKDQKGRISRDVANFYFNELNKPEYTKNKYVNNDIEKFFKLLEEKSDAPLNSTPTKTTNVQKPVSKGRDAATQAQMNAADEANDVIKQLNDNKEEIDYETAKIVYELLNKKEFFDNKYVEYDIQDVLKQLQTVINSGSKSSKSAPVTERSKVSKTRVKKTAPTQKKTGRMTLDAVKGKIKNIVEDFVKNKKNYNFNDEVNSLKEIVLSNKSIKMTGKQFENMATRALIKGWELKGQEANDYTAICDVRNHFIDNGLKVHRCMINDNEDLATYIKNLLYFVKCSDYDYGNQNTKEQQKQPRFREAFGELNSKQLDRISTYAIEKLAPLMSGKMMSGKITEEERQELLDELFQHTAVFKEAAKKIGYDKVAAAIHNDKKRPLEVIIEALFVAQETSRTKVLAESLRKISNSPIFEILYTSDEYTRMMIDGKKSNKKTDLDKKAADVSKQKKSKYFSGDDSETDTEVSAEAKIGKDIPLSSDASDKETDTEVSAEAKIGKDSPLISDALDTEVEKKRVSRKINKNTYMKVTEQRKKSPLRRRFNEDQVG